MLKQRIFTAACLIPLVIWVLFWAPSWLYQTVLTAIFLAAAYEWCVLATPRAWPWIVTWYVLLILSAWLVTYVPIAWVLGTALLGWLAACFTVIRFPRSGAWFRRFTGFRLLTGLWLLIPAWTALWILRTLPYGAIWILLLLLLVWGADIGGYFGGRFLGKHKLAPEVSPKKTIEGLVSGVFLALLLGTLLMAFTLPSVLQQPLFWLLMLSGILISVLGDLTESLFKRIQAVKDSGHLLPGHGGILDRIDSLLAAAPWLTVGLLLLIKPPYF